MPHPSTKSVPDDGSKNREYDVAGSFGIIEYEIANDEAFWDCHKAHEPAGAMRNHPIHVQFARRNETKPR